MEEALVELQPELPLVWPEEEECCLFEVTRFARVPAITT